LEKIYKTKLLNLNIQETKRNMVQCIIGGIQECKHGAILIIGEETVIEGEASRLGLNGRGVCLNSSVSWIQGGQLSNTSDLQQFAAVDGEIFLDFNGMCHAFGVILVGVVRHRGNNSRGSGYNSTKTYIEWIREERYPGTTILGVVKSEDGMVDLF